MHVADGRQGAAAGLVGGPGPDSDIILPGLGPGHDETGGHVISPLSHKI